MTNTTISRSDNGDGTFNYTVFDDEGSYILYHRSRTAYTHASIYKADHSDGRSIVCLHKTEKSALRGSTDGNRYWLRVPGIVAVNNA